MNNKNIVETKINQTYNERQTSEAVFKQTVSDFKNSTLVVSLLVNLFVLTTWLVIEVTDVYNVALINYLYR